MRKAIVLHLTVVLLLVSMIFISAGTLAAPSSTSCAPCTPCCSGNQDTGTTEDEWRIVDLHAGKNLVVWVGEDQTPILTGIDNIVDNTIIIWHYNDLTSIWEIYDVEFPWGGGLTLTEFTKWDSYIVEMQTADTWIQYQHYEYLTAGENYVQWLGTNCKPIVCGTQTLHGDTVIWHEDSPDNHSLYCSYLPDDLNTLEYLCYGDWYYLNVPEDVTWCQ